VKQLSKNPIYYVQRYLYLDIFQVVFVSPYEHHSNLLPWMEIGAKVTQTM